jgi:hypothetical protein
MPPDVRFAGYTDGDPAAVFGIEVSNGVVHGKAAVLTEGNDDFVL